MISLRILFFIVLGSYINCSHKVIITPNCSEGAIFMNTRAISSPPELEKGQTMTLKALGTTTTPIVVTKIEVEAYLNGQLAYTDIKPIKEGKVNPGSDFFYSYDQIVPQFVPTGKFTVQIYVSNDEKRLGCLKAEFDF